MSRKIRYIRLVDNADEVIDFLLLVILCGGIEGAKAPNGKMIDNDDINFLPLIAASDLLGKLNSDPDFLKNFYLDPQAKSKVFGKYWEKYADDVEDLKKHMMKGNNKE